MKKLKQIIIASIVLVIVIGSLGFIKYTKIAKAIAEHKNFALPPETVTTSKAVSENWQKLIPSVGTLAPKQGIMLSSEVEGKVVKISFESGQDVKQGDILVELDISEEIANLEQAKASLDKNKSSLNRSRTLRSKNANSVEDLETSELQYKQSLAQVAYLEAIIEKRKITAPFSGKTGIRQINLGEYLNKGKAIVSLQSLDTLYLNFSVPQQFINELEIGQKVKYQVDAYPKQSFEAIITALNPDVDMTLRNVSVQATYNNADKKLRPGMFAEVKVLRNQFDSVLVIPTTSISYAPYGDTVYVVEKTKDDKGEEVSTVRQQFIKTGDKMGDQIAITDGLKENEEVVTSGLFKLKPNSKVVINNTIQPSNSKNPTPEDT